MNSLTYSFLLTFLAGISTLIGTIIIFIIKKKTTKVIAGSLSFAAGVMITVSLTDLIPESFMLVSNKFLNFPAILICLIFFVIGIILSMLIDYFFPNDVNNLSKSNKKLFRVGIISMLAIILHNIPEGIATFMTSNNNLELGTTLTIAIALHNIPEGICIAVPIYYATKSRVKAFNYTLISALSEPFGAILAFLFLTPLVNDIMMGLLYSIIAGIMIHISLYELLPTALKYKKYFLITIFFIICSLIMIINHII